MSVISGDDAMKRCEYKIPGGKLICARVEVEDDKIASLMISGDFFLLPETALEDLEGQLLGMEITPESIKEKVVSFFTEEKPRSWVHQQKILLV